MNCHEIKDIINESADLGKIDQTAEVAAHLANCANCRAILAYEKKLRQGFAAMTDENAPADLAARIIAIAAESPELPTKPVPSDNWFDRLIASWQGFPFKIAFAAGITGFLAAVMILHQPQKEPTRQPGIVKVAKTESTAPAKDQTSDSSLQVALAPTMPNQKKSAELRASRQLNEGKSSISSEEQIPGAITFSLDTDAEIMVEAASDQAKAERQIAAEPEFQLAKADADECKTIREFRPAAVSRTAAPPSASLRKRMSATNVLSEEHEKTAESFANTGNALADELRQLIEKNAIDLPEGFINLNELAMQGYLPTNQLRRLQPPPGSGWYLQKHADHINVELKKRNSGN
jgi:hypothetical protein